MDDMAADSQYIEEEEEEEARFQSLDWKDWKRDTLDHLMEQAQILKSTLYSGFL